MRACWSGVFGVLGRAIREEPRVFAVAVVGSTLFALLTVAGAYLVGGVVGSVVVPAFGLRRAVPGALALGAAAIMALSLFKVLGIFGRRLGAGIMQFRLQATYRRQVTRRYLELPLAWHHQHPTGTLLSNANSDVEAAWLPIAPLRSPSAPGDAGRRGRRRSSSSTGSSPWSASPSSRPCSRSTSSTPAGWRRGMARVQQLRAEVSAIAHESFDGALVVKTMGREAAETAVRAKAVELRDALIGVGRLRGIFDPTLDALPSLGTLAVLVVGAVRLRRAR